MQVVIAGSAAVITSSLTLEDVKTLEKYDPNALTLYGGKDGDEPMFQLGLSDSASGSIGKCFAEFGTQTAEGGKATVTVVFREPLPKDAMKEHVADVFGGALLYLEELEGSIPAALEKINAQKANVLSKITVA